MADMKRQQTLTMRNLAEISLDLICALKFSPPGGYEVEDIAAMANACWQTIMHGLDPQERSAVIDAARSHIEELTVDPVETLPEYLRHKLDALQELVAVAEQCQEPE